MFRRRRRSWWRDLDFPGLLGCAALLVATYAMFWYYAESVKGHFDPPNEPLQSEHARGPD